MCPSLHIKRLRTVHSTRSPRQSVQMRRCSEVQLHRRLFCQLGFQIQCDVQLVEFYDTEIKFHMRSGTRRTFLSSLLFSVPFVTVLHLICPTPATKAIYPSPNETDGSGLLSLIM